MFAAASRREFDRLLFWSLDRLSREGTVETLNHLQRLTTFPHTPTEDINIRAETTKHEFANISSPLVLASIASVAPNAMTAKANPPIPRI